MLNNTSTFRGRVHELVFDKIYLSLLQLKELTTRSISFAVSVDLSSFTSELPDPASQGGKLVGINSGGTGFTYYAVNASGYVPLTPYSTTILEATTASEAQTALGISTFIKTLLDDADAATAQTTLGISAFAQTLLDDADAATAQNTLGCLATGVQSVNFPASSFIPQTTGGSGTLQSAETSTNRVMVRWIPFDAATQETAQVQFKARKSQKETSSVSGRIVWRPNGGTLFNVVWAVSAAVISPGDDMDAAFATGVTVTGSASGSGEVAVTEFTGMSLGSMSEGDLVVVKVIRVAADAADTCNADADLMHLVLDIDIDAKNDS